MAAWLTSACRLRGPVALYFGRVGGSGRGTRDQQEDARELEHPFHQSRGALEAARLHTCGRSDRAGADRLHRRPARDRSRGQAQLRLPPAGGADVREPQERTRGGRRPFPGRRQAQQLPDRPEVPADLPRRCATATWPTQTARPARPSRFRAWRARARCSRSRRWRYCRRRHARSRRRKARAGRATTKASRPKRK